MAQALEQPPVAIITSPGKGRLPSAGSLGSISPSSLQVIALKKADNGKGLILRVQETAGKTQRGTFTFMGNTTDLGIVRAKTIVSWRLSKKPSGWKAVRTNIIEENQ